MKYQDRVEKAQEDAQEEYDAAIGDIIDAAKEQDEGDVDSS